MTPKTGSQSLGANETAGIQPQNIEENKRNDLLLFSWSKAGYCATALIHRLSASTRVTVPEWPEPCPP